MAFSQVVVCHIQSLFMALQHNLLFSYVTLEPISLSPGLWGLVNNAGVWWCAELDMMPEKILHRVMDVNLFGAVRVTTKLLPLVKRARGRVVNVSSLLGESRVVNVSSLLGESRVVTVEIKFKRDSWYQ